jgi:hypothetical protein
MSLGSTGYVSEDEDQVNYREDVGFRTIETIRMSKIMVSKAN